MHRLRQEPGARNEPCFPKAATTNELRAALDPIKPFATDLNRDRRRLEEQDTQRGDPDREVERAAGVLFRHAPGAPWLPTFDPP